MDGVNAIMYAQTNDDLACTFEVPNLPGEEGGNSAGCMKGNTDLNDYLSGLFEKWMADGTIEQMFNDAVELQISLGVE